MNQELNSCYWNLCPVVLPTFKGRQKYMHTFNLADPAMAEGYEDYLDVVKTLCAKAGASEGFAHMTVDEKVVKRGETQRRPGPHVDGCFMPELGAWGHGGWVADPAKRLGRMPIIVASNVAACKCYSGTFSATPRSDGDLSHVALPEGELVPSNTGFLLSADCIHESMLMTETTERIFLRIALPVGFKCASQQRIL